MNVLRYLSQLRSRLWPARPAPLEPAGELPWDAHWRAWLVSFSLHLALLVVLGLIIIKDPEKSDVLALVTEPPVEHEPLAVSEEFSAADLPTEEISATSAGNADADFVAAPVLSMTTVLPSEPPAEELPAINERVTIQDDIRLATGPRVSDNLVVKGAAGAGATGTTGAVDRITQEILLSLEERRTLVVWFFDQSGSLARQRGEIIKRFDRIYEELGVIEAAGNPAFKKHDDKPLLSAVVSFGERITFLTPKPTDDLQDIKKAVAGIKTDDSGIERTFTAVADAVQRYKQFRTQEPRRNIRFIIFTDEVGDDENELDRTVGLCNRFAIPVFCVGVPAPFGRREAAIKYIDPDPKFDQTPQWVNVRQGPESFLPELVTVGPQDEDAMDSGFGPYSLTRLCYETGGIFFAVHPNREERRVVSRRDTPELASQLSHFFDDETMRGYRPDYVSIKEYQRLLGENKARKALVEAAQMSALAPMERPELRFPKINDADLANRLTRAQQTAAVLEPKIERLYQVLKQGEKDRARLTKPRWQAGYDCSMGRVLAVKVRTEGYNAMLAKAKQGMSFADPKNDTWQLVPDNEISVGTALEKQAQQARQYLQRVVQEHPGTPWALLAQRELEQPLGWKWKELYAGVNAPPPQVAAMPNNPPRQPQNDRAQMLPRPERRPPPKL